MRIFVTGASGFIGSATVRNLLSAGHTVLGLARSPSSAKILSDLGVEVHNGSLDDLESLKSGATQCDGVIHLAFVHEIKEISDFAASCAKDRLAIEALGGVLAGTGKPLVVTSGILLLKGGEVRTEEDAPDMESFGAMRGASEQVTLELAKKGVKAMIIRLPPTVHGEGDKGFVPRLVSTAREKGVSAYIGNGLNRWTAVHRLDAATLYRLVIEKGVTGGVYHGVAEESIVAKDIAKAIGKGLNVPVVSKPVDEAVKEMGFLAYAFSSDGPASSAKTRAELGWKPEQPGLIVDAEKSYFK
jgi:nucleoside-diphosphate-sugar epimerase